MKSVPICVNITVKLRLIPYFFPRNTPNTQKVKLPIRFKLFLSGLQNSILIFKAESNYVGITDNLTPWISEFIIFSA